MGLTLDSLPQDYRALVIGASGAIGGAFVDALQADPRCGGVLALHRRSQPSIDFEIEESIGRAALAVADHAPFHLIVEAAGILHTPQFGPEKRLADLHYAQMRATFTANTFGPALVLRHFSPLLAKKRAVMALLTAKVGSVGDNRLGGWYSYRASKAALHMLVKTAAIELGRTRSQAVVVSLHPGTVRSALSRPFGGETKGRSPAQAAADMLAVLDRLEPADSGDFFSWSGERLPW